MEIIKLNKDVWKLDTNKILGAPGGFGEVFQGSGDVGDVAIKRLKVTASQAAHRELQIGESLAGRDFNNIVPILDYGQDANSDRYYLVMPVCDRSLQDEIIDKGKVSPSEAIEILISILSGLLEASDITHRDIKPHNILLHDSVWKVADFGIAKFVEDSTSKETLRSSLTPPYAAPEQWKLERPTSATDIYASGCIAHALITGVPPFSGDVDSLRDQHISSTPQQLSELSANVRALVFQMLRKNPVVRPNLKRCIQVLSESRADTSSKNSQVNTLVTEAVSQVAAIQAIREKEDQEKSDRKEERKLIYKEALVGLKGIKDELFDRIKIDMQDVINNDYCSEHLIRLEGASLNIHIDKYAHKNDPYDFQVKYGGNGWGQHSRQSTWDILTILSMKVVQTVDSSTYTRCANLVFGKPNDNSEYRWYEMGFWSASGRDPKPRPFCLNYPWEIDEVLSGVITVIQFAYNPVPIDCEDKEKFINYWMELFAQAAIGKLDTAPSVPMKR